LKCENIERTCEKMNLHFPKSLVRGYESIIPTLQLPDMNDRHVFAAAIHVNAGYIVTFDLGDFPNTILQSHNIEAVLPDDFILRLLQSESYRVVRAIRRFRTKLTRPPKTVDEYLATLEKQGLAKTVAFLRERKDDL